MAWTTCNSCNGSGVIDVDYEVLDCPDCGGTGMVDYAVDDGPRDNIDLS